MTNLCLLVTGDPVERQSVADLAIIKMGGAGVELSQVELKHQEVSCWQNLAKYY
jgi:hypothetical protein